MTILGLNAYAHDAGVALVDGGGPRFACDEERFNRVKKTSAFPVRGLDYLQQGLGLRWPDVEAVAFPWRPRRFLLELGRMILPGLPQSLNLLRRAASPNLNLGSLRRFFGVGGELARTYNLPRPPPLHFVSHHLAHASTAFFLSPFDRAVILVMDAYGDECSVSWFQAQGASIRLLATNRFFDSLGVLYSIVTKHLGYSTIVDEGKVMALASYGTPALNAAFRELVPLLPAGRFRIDRRYFRYHRYGEMQPMSPRFVQRFGPARRPEEPLTQHHMDLAHALQRTVEDTILHAARYLSGALGETNLCFAGGLALNCIANGRLARESGFERVFVPPNPNDSGVALGAALAVRFLPHEATRNGRPPAERPSISATPYLGADYGEAATKRALRAAGLAYEQRDDAPEVAARALAGGGLVGWYQGACEMGPRALGNRSILADPRDPFMATRLNQRVKRREYFRPYAPSVLAERAAEFFVDPPASPYMSFAALTRPERRAEIPAVVARDGTARVQTVTAELNPLYHRLIAAFAELTGVPMVLNTSFNAQEPVVCSPEDAIRTFRAGGLDLLVLGRCVVGRPDAAGGERH